MLTEAQHALRRTGITSTDITRIVGESPFGTAHDVYAEKRFPSPAAPPTLPQRIGQMLEPLVCELIAEQFGIELAPGDTVRHPVLPWVLSTPDGLAASACGEAKVKSVYFGPEWLDHDVPPSWVHVQCQWHMIALRVPVCYVGALLGCNPHFWIVESDEYLAGTLIAAGEAFHRDHVIAGVAPAVDGSAGARRMLRAAWPRASAAMFKASPAAEALARSYFAAKAKTAEANADLELARQRLTEYAADAQGIQGDGWRLLLGEQAAAEMPGYTRCAYRRFDMRRVGAGGSR